MTIPAGARQLPISVQDFAALQRQQMRSARDLLVQHWCKEAEAIFQEHVSANPHEDEAVTERLFECAAAVMSAQLRGVVALHSAALSGDVEIAEALVRAGADTSLRADDGKDALDFAREGKHPELVRLLERS